jgi:hypothetical protein
MTDALGHGRLFADRRDLPGDDQSQAERNQPHQRGREPDGNVPFENQAVGEHRDRDEAQQIDEQQWASQSQSGHLTSLVAPDPDRSGEIARGCANGIAAGREIGMGMFLRHVARTGPMFQ